MITIDDRECTQHPNIPEAIGIPYIIERLEAADYAFLTYEQEPVGIERAEIGNLVQKLRSGELESQLLKCQSNYAHTTLLIEGVYDSTGGLLSVYKRGNRGYFRVHVYPNTTFQYVKASEVRLSQLGVELIYSPDFKSSLGVIKSIYDQRTKAEGEHTLFRRTRSLIMPTKLTANPAVARLMALAPRFNEKVAIRLINKYGSIWNILHTDDKELLEVEGVGKGLLKKIKDGVGKTDDTNSVLD